MSITSAKSGATGISLALDNNFMEPIATTLVGAGGVSVIEFRDIPQNYKHLHLRATLRETGATTDNNAYMYINSDYSARYSYHFTWSSGSATASAGGGPSTSVALGFRMTGGSSASGVFGAGFMDILDYSNTSKNKVSRVLSGHDQSGSGYLFYWSNLWQSFDPITTLTFIPTAGNFAQYSRISLYGIKG